jgi:hypothetical protein
VLKSVEQVAIQLGVSKTAIYNKLKLKEFKTIVIKKQGKSMVDEDLFNLIEYSLKLKPGVKNGEKIENGDYDFRAEIATDTEDILNSNKGLIDTLIEQLKEKDKQILELHKLIENNQVLLKQQQDKEIKQLCLEEHFKEVDNKLVELKTKMEDKKVKKKSIFEKFFK